MRSGIYLNDKEKQKKRRILKLKIYGFLAAFFILIAITFYSIIYSPAFQIMRIDTALIDADKTKINTDEIINNLGLFFINQSKLARFLGHDNILIWNKEKISEFIKNYSAITELTIEKDYFKRYIKITIKEREKFGIWCAASCYWFDKFGIILTEAPGIEGDLINNVRDLSDRSLKPGEPILKEKFVKNIIKIFEVLEKSNIKIKSLKLENLELQEIIIDSPTMPKIYFSLRFSPEFALTALESFRKIGFEKIEYIDFRVENRAYYKLK